MLQLGSEPPKASFLCVIKWNSLGLAYVIVPLNSSPTFIFWAPSCDPTSPSKERVFQNAVFSSGTSFFHMYPWLIPSLYPGPCSLRSHPLTEASPEHSSEITPILILYPVTLLSTYDTWCWHKHSLFIPWKQGLLYSVIMPSRQLRNIFIRINKWMGKCAEDFPNRDHLIIFSNYSQWLPHKSTFGPKAYRTTVCVLGRNEHIKKKKLLE